SGIPFDQYISQRIFAPLKMTHSFTNEPAAIADGMATGHLYFSNLFPVPYQALYSRGRLGEGFIISSAEDMTHYLLAMMHEGAYGGTAALPSAAVKAVTTPAVPEGRYPGANSYGMGWSIGRRGSDLIWLHGGATSTFRAEMAILPNSFRGVIVLANAKLDTTEGVNRLANALVQILRDQEPNLATAAPASSAYALLALFCGALLIALADLLWLPRWRRQVRARGITRWDWLRTAFSLALALGFLVGLPMSLGANLLFAMRVDPYDGAVICAVGALALAAFGYRLAVIWRSKKEVPSHHAQAS
ncbi:MAG TPA: serine hydrolase, partial [Symbiobacteriaceae bacterium]|nr:serine hydrolase [Symbiobacteriaceae bacterium]